MWLLQQVPLPSLQANSRLLLLLLRVNANFGDRSESAASCHLAQGQAVGVLREAHQQPACIMTSLLWGSGHTGVESKSSLHRLATSTLTTS